MPRDGGGFSSSLLVCAPPLRGFPEPSTAGDVRDGRRRRPGRGAPPPIARTGPDIANFRIERFRIKPFAAGYQAGFEAVAALAISILVGLWADIRFDTGVVFLVIGSVVGFGSCVLRMVRYQRQVEREAAMAAARLHAMQTTDTPVGASTRPGDRDQAS